MKRQLVVWVGSILVLAGCGTVSFEVNAVTPTRERPQFVLLDSATATNVAVDPPMTATNGVTDTPMIPVITVTTEPSLTATNEPGPSATEDTSATLETFRQSVINAVIAQDVSAMASLMKDPHLIAYWASEGPWSRSSVEAANELVTSEMTPGESIAFTEPPADLFDRLASYGLDLQVVFGPSEPVDVLFSTGWHLDGIGQAILLITQETNGSFRWYGTLIAPGGFQS